MAYWWLGLVAYWWLTGGSGWWLTGGLLVARLVAYWWLTGGFLVAFWWLNGGFDFRSFDSVTESDRLPSFARSPIFLIGVLNCYYMQYKTHN